MMILTLLIVLLFAIIGIIVAVKFPQRAVSAALALVIIGSIAFHFWTPWWWTEIASNWGAMDDTIILTFWVTGTVFCAVCLFMSYCVWKFRYRKDQKADYEPENSKLEWGLTIFTTIGVCALLAPGLIVWDKYVDVPEEAMDIEVMGQQWYWNFRLPGEDGILGLTDFKNIDDDNPFGINLDDPYGKDDILIQDDVLHLKTDRPVKILLRSLDVLHNYYVPQFRAKMDAIPGIISYYWFEPNKIGEYEVLCAEYCGVGHYAMRAKVIVESEGNYKNWIKEQETFSDLIAKKENDKLKTTLIVKNNN